MKKVKVIDINNYNYTLVDNNDITYIVNIEFYDIKVDIGDYIYLPNEVLKEKNLYAYGPIEHNTSIDNLIKIIKDNKEIYLERYYG